MVSLIKFYLIEFYLLRSTRSQWQNNSVNFAGLPVYRRDARSYPEMDPRGFPGEKPPPGE